MSPSSPIPFTGNPLDRASDKRVDKDWLLTARNDARARFVLVWKSQPLLKGAEGTKTAELLFVDATTAGMLGPETAQEIFLGLDDSGIAYFARDVSTLPEPVGASLPGLAHPRDGRAAAASLPFEEVAIMGQAKALLGWHEKHPFCSVCGKPTVSAEGGYKRVCPSCKAEHFPRTDPAVIMLATYKDEKGGDFCLLAHNTRFPPNRFSTLAGFVEPGESFEEAVRREIFEEVNLRIGEVRYFATQPWPFPASVMIGCYAQALSREVKADGVEIEDARWFDRATILRLLAGETMEGVEIPQRQAIAHHLIRNWAEGT
jgi:NAD+ diphosphatase